MLTKIKKPVSILLSLIMVFSLFTMIPLTASADAAYVKVTEEPDDWSGDYLIVYENGEYGQVFDGSLDTLDATWNTFDVTISDGVIASNADTDAAKFTITADSGNYIIQSASGYYIGNGTTNNKLESSTSQEYTNTITIESDSAKITGSGGTVMRFNSSSAQMRFRYFKAATYTSQQPIQLYKLTAGSAPTPTTYTVTWKNWDDSVLETDVVTEGTVPAYDGETPIKADDAQYTYTFAGWSPEISPAASDITYTAVFNETVREYTVTFQNEDGTELQSSQLAYGATPEYKGATPVKADEDGITYMFAGWTPAVKAVTEAATYTASFVGLTRVEAKEPTYTSAGNIEHYTGSDGKYYIADSDGYKATTLEAITIAQLALVHHDAVAPTCTESGISEYWHDEVNDKYFTDANGEHEILLAETVVPATGHSYVEGECEYCHEKVSGFFDGKYYVDGILAEGIVDGKYYIEGVDQEYTGIVLIDGVYYDFDNNGIRYSGLFYDDDAAAYRYAKLGVLAGGWIDIDNSWYYIRTSNLKAATGVHTINGLKFTFDETGKLVAGVWVDTEYGKRYYYGPSYYKAKNAANVAWGTINGDLYGFDTHGACYTGINKIVESNSKDITIYEFDENGVCQGLLDLDGYTGFVVTKNFGTYYVTNGEFIYNGLIEVDGDYYYVRSNSLVAVGSYAITKTNGLMTAGPYEFNQDGKMILKNGIVDGYYYVDGCLYYAGLIEVDGNYYYVKTSGKLATGSYYVTKNNDLLPSAYYEFDEDGKMILKNGIVDGCYYVDGCPYYAGLIEVDGNYYYVKTSGKLATGSYYVTKNNDLLSCGYYDFAEDGKMIVKNGIIDGVYYENGMKTYAGLIEIDGYYYYVRSNGMVATGSYTVTKTNGLKPQGVYEFDEDGKMVVKSGIVGGVYYENGDPTYAGLIEIGGSYYYAKHYGVLATGTYYVTKNNGLMASGYYTFGADGKMITD